MSLNQPLENKANSKIIHMIIAGFFVFILAIGVLYITTIDKPIGEEYKPVYEYGGDFTLKTLSKEISLVDFRDKVVIIYFGFLNCSEACPVSMGTITKAISQMTPEERTKVQVLYISVDPERDSLDKLSQFSKYYAKRYENETNPEMIIATTGTVDEIEALTKLYGVFFELIDLENSSLSYTVDHSSRFYMLGTDGKLVTTMSHSTTPIELVARTRELLAVKDEQSHKTQP